MLIVDDDIVKFYFPVKDLIKACSNLVIVCTYTLYLQEGERFSHLD